MKYQNICFKFAFWMKIWVLRLNIHFLHEVQFLFTDILTCVIVQVYLNTLNIHIYMVMFHTFCYMYLFKLPNMPWVKMCQSFIILFSTVIHIYIYIFIDYESSSFNIITCTLHHMILYDLIKTSLNQVCLSVIL